MMKRIIVFILSNMLFFVAATAQDIPVRTLPNEIFKSVKKDDKDTTKWIWKRGGLVNLNLSQGSLSNWSAGGDNFSMSLNSHVNYSVFYRKGVHTWDNSFDFNFGYVQTSSLGSRKNDDRIDFLSKYGRQLLIIERNYRNHRHPIDTIKNLYASTLFDFRSQMFDGRNYTSNTASNLTSTFLSPAYIILSVGFDYKPKPTFSIFFSPLTNRTTLVATNRISAKTYGVDSGKHVYNEVGAFASINYFLNIKKDIITYKGRLDLFSNYARNPQNVDIYMTNLFSFKINKFLAATYSLESIYDDNIKLFGPNHTSPGLQLKSLIGIGFTMPFAEEKR